MVAHDTLHIQQTQQNRSPRRCRSHTSICCFQLQPTSLSQVKTGSGICILGHEAQRLNCESTQRFGLIVLPATQGLIRHAAGISAEVRFAAPFAACRLSAKSWHDLDGCVLQALSCTCSRWHGETPPSSHIWLVKDNDMQA